VTNLGALMDALEALPTEPVRLRRVIIADNGSTDGSPAAAAARGARVVHEPQRGYGAACLEGLASIQQDPNGPPDIVVFLDADLADDPAALPELVAPIAAGRCDIAIGSRLRRAEPGSLNLAQRFGNTLACTLIEMATRRRYTDLGPFRAVRWETLAVLAMADRTWGWTVEMQMKAALMEIPTLEVDVPYRARRGGRSKISGTVRGVVAAGAKIISTILTLWAARRQWSPDRRNLARRTTEET
jgi:glycosyltransferase involved in cell wall biosynthesis